MADRSYRSDGIGRVKLAWMLPSGTMTWSGCVTLRSRRNRSTLAPPSGAGSARVTVPVTCVPGTKRAVSNVRDSNSGTATRTVALSGPPGPLAVISTDWDTEACAAVSGNVTALWSAGTVTAAGAGSTEGESEERWIGTPPAGAG